MKCHYYPLLRKALFVIVSMLASLSAVYAQSPLETRDIGLKNCIGLYEPNERVIEDEESYLKAVRRDASRERCLTDAGPIDFNKYTLIGIELNTGYCRTPPGLGHKVLRDDAKKTYLFTITWLESGQVCRALSQYDLWLLVPKLPRGYQVAFRPQQKM